MKTKATILAAALLAVTATAGADVTVTTMSAGKAAFINVDGEGVNKIKGARMRTDQAFRGKGQTLIIDIDGRRFIDLDEKKKSAVVIPLDSIADDLEKVGVGTMQATLKKTAQTKQIAGYPCTVHDVSLSLPFSPTGQTGQGMDLTMQLTGTVCLSTSVPGLADYQAFYKSAADSGFIFGDPRTARSPTGAAQAKALGDNPMAALMGKAAKSDITTTVTKIETPALDAAEFDIPAGFKVKTQK
jgi:hypothetical protein